MILVNKSRHKNLTIWLLLLMFACSSLFIIAEPLKAETNGYSTSSIPVVMVGADASVTVAPDQARISLAVISSDQDLQKAQESNNKTTNNVIETLLKQNIAKEDIKTTNFTVYPQYNYNNTKENVPPEIVGYRVRNEISVLVKDLDKLGILLDLAVKSGANNVNFINYEKSNIALQENEALVKAVQRARSKANAIANAAGMNVGKVLSINEGSTNHIFPPRPVYYANESKQLGAGSQVPVNPGLIEVSASISITYELVQ